MYGVKSEPKVTEDMSCEPLTDYSKYKLMCEEDLKMADLGGCEWTIIRPATISGYAPRLRLDLIINALTIHCLVNKKIIVHGGPQTRPNINIRDMVGAYVRVLEETKEQVHKQIFNVGAENYSVNELANMVRLTLTDPNIQVIKEPTIDPRSYQVNSDKIKRELGFVPRHRLPEAISSILLNVHKLRDPLTNPYYYNVKRMNEMGVK